jgi:hypothetical protein
MAFVLMGCSDNSASLEAPTDQAAREQGSLQKATIVPFTTTDYPVEVLDPGEVRIVEGNLVMKNVVVLERFDSDNPMVNGTLVHNLSLVLDLTTGEGPCRGTFTLTPDADVGGGVWEGAYSGYRTRIGDQVFTLPLTSVGRGKGGTIEGIKMNENLVLTAFGTPPTYWYGTGEGYLTIHSFNGPPLAKDAVGR